MSSVRFFFFRTDYNIFCQITAAQCNSMNMATQSIFQFLEIINTPMLIRRNNCDKIEMQIEFALEMLWVLLVLLLLGATIVRNVKINNSLREKSVIQKYTWPMTYNDTQRPLANVFVRIMWVCVQKQAIKWVIVLVINKITYLYDIDLSLQFGMECYRFTFHMQIALYCMFVARRNQWWFL